MKRLGKWNTIFGPDAKIDDPAVKEKLAKEAIRILYWAAKGKITEETQIRAAEFIAGRLAYPLQGSKQPHIAIHLRWEDIEKAKEKAGLKLLLPQKIKEITGG